MRYFDQVKELSLLGIHTISPGYKDKEAKIPLPDLVSTQFWSNANLDKKGENIKVLNMRLSKDRKYIYFSHNDLMSNEALKFFPTQQIYEWLLSIKDRDSIHYDRMIIAPKIELFLGAAKAELNLDGIGFFILGKTHHVINVNKPQVRKIIKLLKGKNLPSLDTTRLNQIMSAVKNYRDRKLIFPLSK